MIYKFIDDHEAQITVNSLSQLQTLVESQTIKKNTKVKAGLRGEWKKAKYNKPDNQRGRDGTGTYTYANGDKYVGEWKKGLRHGKGTFTHFNGKVEEGIWKKDKLVKLKQ